MKLNVNFKRLVFGLILPHKRTAVRVLWLQCLMGLITIWEAFAFWRTNQRRLANINCRVKVLENFLRWKFDQRIRVLTYSEELVGISLLAEGQLLPVGLLEEGSPMAEFPLLGERVVDFGDADFVVSVPSGVDVAAVRREIERYKLIDKHYKIIVQ